MWIQGAGPIGLSVLAAARALGAGDVCVTEPLAYRRVTAERAGARWTYNPYAGDAEAAIATAQPAQFDVVFECCGQQDALDQALRHLRPGGRLMIVGIPEVDRVSFSIDTLRRREITITNVRRQNGCMQAAIDLLAHPAFDPDLMITHHYALDHSKAAFDLVAGYRDGVIKAIVHREL
jgi:threonine dehydrogenase-like Zn-dependent dehydrogenase